VSAASPKSFSSVLLRHGRLAMKELRETLRDRRTIVTLVLMPILVYPLLSMAFQRFLVAGIRNQGRAGYSIAVVNPEVREMMAGLISMLPMLDDAGKPMKIEFTEEANLSEAVAHGGAVLGVGVNFDRNRVPVIEFYYREDFESRFFAREFESRLLYSNIGTLRLRLSQNQLPDRPPAYTFRRPVPVTTGQSPLASLVPLILILMTITGAVYPAIDLTAGERERGTLETLIAAPVPRISLLLAKYVAVVMVALLTATVNLVAMTATMQLSGLGVLLFGREGLSITTVISVFGLLVLFAAFFSAILLSITAFARSFKEAQAYLIPLMLLSIAPGLLSMMPEVVLTPWLAAVPLVNMVLVARDVFLGDINSRLAVVAIVTTIFYAVAAIGFAARIFGADAILYGSHRSWSDLLERPTKPRAALALGAALTCVAVLFPGQFLVNGLLSQMRSLPLAAKLVAAAIGSVMLFVGIPWIGTRLNRVPFEDGFRAKLTNPLYFVAAGLLGVSLWPLAVWTLQWGAKIGLSNFTAEQLQQVDDLLRQLNALPVWLVVIAIGIVPGITEELFFRGVLFQSLRKSCSPAATIIIAAVLFALFHLVTPGLMTTERLLPSLVMGLVLGWVAYRSGSVFPSVIIHAVHNGLFLAMSPTYQSSGTPTAESILELKLPTQWVIGAMVGIAFGLLITVVAPRRDFASAKPVAEV